MIKTKTLFLKRIEKMRKTTTTVITNPSETVIKTKTGRDKGV